MLLNRSWGARGHPFAQHYSCPAFLDAQLVLQVVAVGIFFRMWSIASIAQGQALHSIGKAATSVLPPFTPMCFFFQNECASYAGRSGRTSLCSRRLAGRWFFQFQSQTCHKLVPAFAATWYWARLLLSNISWKIYNAPMKPSDKLISYKIKMQSSKLRATSFQQVALRDFENSGGSARSDQKTFKKIKFLKIKIKRAHKQFLSRFYILYILHIKIILISLKTCS